MAKLILSMDGMVLKEVVLTKERMTIGRKPHNDLVIDNLAVSGEHAVIVTILNDSFLEDLGSTNGTFVNGQPIKKHFLQNGDMIELGKYKLKFVADAPATLAPDLDKAVTLQAGVPTDSLPGLSTSQRNTALAATRDLGQTASMLSLSPPTTSTNPNMQRAPLFSGSDVALAARIVIMDGPNAGRELQITKALTTLGRPGVQVAVITRRPNGYFITHVEGAHYPIVNGKVLGAEACALHDNDMIELSSTRMQFRLSALGANAQPESTSTNDV
ncbi:MAG TPA: FHA domain-containing protein [Burkholderiaceae bacterium]|nr:FHA domain-containing protein [Burkholderiaceae bacterium]